VFTELLKQPQYSPVPIENQILSIFTAVEGYFDEAPATQLMAIEKELHKYVSSSPTFSPYLFSLADELDEEALHAIIDLFFSANHSEFYIG
jgi:F-type H+-transporting ATPase subunit alpha